VVVLLSPSQPSLANYANYKTSCKEQEALPQDNNLNFTLRIHFELQNRGKSWNIIAISVSIIDFHAKRKENFIGWL
jgi:hypothetical protein